jgi:transposase, IS30 family
MKRNEFSQKEIAKKIKRHPSTISRELRRNTLDKIIGYLPDEASIKANERMARHGLKLDRHPELQKIVIEKLKLGWSPDAISGRMKQQNKAVSISCESIYKWIYNKKNNQKLFQYLLRKRPRRGNWKSRRPNKSTIPERVSIHERPALINNRSTFGHYEGDLTFTKGSQSINITTIVERKSKLVLLHKNNSKKSTEVMKNAFNKLALLPKEACSSVTFDNGSEFAKHILLKKVMKINTYFCDPRSPWQKGQVEKINAMLHRHIPKKQSLSKFSSEQISCIEEKMNNTPLRILGFKTPAEVFHNEMSSITTSRPLKTLGAEEEFPLRGIKGGDTHNSNKIALQT